MDSAFEISTKSRLGRKFKDKYFIFFIEPKFVNGDDVVFTKAYFIGWLSGTYPLYRIE